MSRIEPPDSHHCSAAIGWLELGNADEALADLHRVSARNRHHPDVLEIRWAVLAHQKDWTAALEAARTILRVSPKRSSGWLHCAYALRRVPEGGLQAAWDALLPAFIKFPEEPVIPFNLACYACQLDRLDDARVWLDRAFQIGSEADIRDMALHDADLKPLWDEIRKRPRRKKQSSVA